MRKKISSWMSVFSSISEVRYAESIEELREAVSDGFLISGSLHSYNRTALHPKTVFLRGKFFKRMSVENGIATIGAACTIEEVMNFLRAHGRRLVNSGNHRKQTLVGAIMTGTHGFGKDAVIADSVVEYHLLDGSENMVTAVSIKTKPLVQYRVCHCTDTLSSISDSQSKNSRAYAVMPYSGSDPVCVSSEYIELDYPAIPTQETSFNLPLSWWRLKLWWAVDALFPPLRRWIQRSMSYLSIPARTIITDAQDIDALYHPWPSTDGGNNPKFILWAYKPTFTCFNIALFAKPEDTQEVIKEAMYAGDLMKKDLFRCFIGVRELTTKGTIFGNKSGPVNAIDFYCTPDNSIHLINLQKHLQSKFDLVPHKGKAVQ